METPRIEHRSGGLQCDNPVCDWTDPTVKVEDYEKWLNAPCPKCGENVLTEEDYNTTKNLLSMVDMINDLPDELYKEFLKIGETLSGSSNEDLLKKYDLPEDTERVTMTLDLHNGVSIKSVTPADNGTE